MIELLAGGVLLWRLRVEQRAGTLEKIRQAERRASLVTAISCPGWRSTCSLKVR
ncbi:MAG TPA: hypothetical protein VGF67_23445 [Ktedonobacteraceae bacterium]